MLHKATFNTHIEIDCGCYSMCFVQKNHLIVVQALPPFASLFMRKCLTPPPFYAVVCIVDYVLRFANGVASASALLTNALATQLVTPALSSSSFYVKRAHVDSDLPQLTVCPLLNETYVVVCNLFRTRESAYSCVCGCIRLHIRFLFFSHENVCAHFYPL